MIYSELFLGKSKYFQFNIAKRKQVILRSRGERYLDQRKWKQRV